MGVYRARDLVNAPTLISLLRIPLAGLFPLVREDVRLSLFVLALAAGTDILDGWMARRFQRTTPMGAVVDGLTDKAFVAVVLTTLVTTKIMAPIDLLLLGVRELGELPLVVWLLFNRAARRRKQDDRANVFGKAATVLQFSTIVAILARSKTKPVLMAMTVVVGALAALSYWRRALAAARTDSGESRPNESAS